MEPNDARSESRCPTWPDVDVSRSARPPPGDNMADDMAEQTADDTGTEVPARQEEPAADGEEPVPENYVPPLEEELASDKPLESRFSVLRIARPSRLSSLDVQIPVTLTWSDVEIFVRERGSETNRCSCKKKDPASDKPQALGNVEEESDSNVFGQQSNLWSRTSIARDGGREDAGGRRRGSRRVSVVGPASETARGGSGWGAPGEDEEKIKCTVGPSSAPTPTSPSQPPQSPSALSKCPPGMKQIVFGVNGMVKAGTMLAVMGSSGAGKSTLMNVLAMRNLKGYVMKGQVKVNGIPVSNEIHNISAYVQQDDLFIGTMTVRETLMFRAYLRLDQSLSRKELREKVDEVLMEMGLRKCQNAHVGVPGTAKSISGGEAKRLSFACEMLTNPPIMFCDEPTSGLDTFMARAIVRTMQRLAFLHHIVICTIHQPSSEVFAMFDRVLLMAEGRVAFMGPSTRAMEFFNGLGHVCPSNYNPADFFVLTLAVAPGDEQKSRKRLRTICNAYDLTPEAETMRRGLDPDKVTSEELRGKLFSRSKKYKASMMRQFGIVLWRSWISLTREKVLFRLRLVTGLAISFVVGLIFYDLQPDQKGVMDFSGAIFSLLLIVSFNNLFTVLHTFPSEISLFLRDHGSKLYRCDVYYLAKSVAELPMLVVVPALVVSIAYWMIGMRNSLQAFFIAIFYYIIVGNVAVSFGHIVSTASANEGIALAAAPPLTMPALMLGGFFLNDESVPNYLKWLKYLSWFKFGNELITVNQWKNMEKISCHLPPPAPGSSGATNMSQLTYGVGCLYTTGNDVLRHLSFSDDNFALDLGALFALWIGFRIFAYFFLVLWARTTLQ